MKRDLTVGQTICYMIFSPSFVCDLLVSTSDNGYSQPGLQGQEAQADDESESESAEEEFHEGESAVADRATKPIEQPVWLGLRH